MTGPDDESGADEVRAGEGRPAAAGRRTGPPRLLSLGLIAVVIAAVALPIGLVVLMRASGPTTYSYTVPSGTGARQDAGEVVAIMPTDLNLEIGDHLVIVNDDDRAHTVGLFTVRAGETLDMPFRQAGVFKGACTMNADGQIVITVT